MLQTKALYNLLRLNAAEDATVTADLWAVEDLRLLAMDELFLRLEKYKVRLTRISFHQFSDRCDTPEELTDLLLPDGLSEKERDPFYLLIFELWRRLLSERQSLSIFCDELDHRITLYDQGNIESDELVQDALANLLEVLDENVDAGADPKDVFTAVSNYCANDLEQFIYDYIAELLDNGNSLYASELIEGFFFYITEPLWFDLLKARLLAFTDIDNANLAIHRLLENALDLPLLLEILYFLATNGKQTLFILAVNKAIACLSSNEELIEVMTLVADYYRRLDEEVLEQAVQKLLKQRKELRSAFDPKDPDLVKLQGLLLQST